MSMGIGAQENSASPKGVRTLRSRAAPGCPHCRNFDSLVFGASVAVTTFAESNAIVAARMRSLVALRSGDRNLQSDPIDQNQSPDLATTSEGKGVTTGVKPALTWTPRICAKWSDLIGRPHTYTNCRRSDLLCNIRKEDQEAAA